MLSAYCHMPTIADYTRTQKAKTVDFKQHYLHF
jgi:hypothetical protein